MADESDKGGLLTPDDGAENQAENLDINASGGISLPPGVEELPGFIKSQFAMYQGPIPNPVLNKVNEGHIDKALEIARTEQEQQFQLQQREQDTERSNR